MQVTLEDIAKRANVSKMTVSRVINKSTNVAEKTRERIQSVIDELDYQPNQMARNLSIKSTSTIGVIVPKEEKIFLDNYIAQVLSGVSEVVKDNDYRILLLPIDEENVNYANYIKSRVVDGLVLLKMKNNDPGLKKIVSSGLPYIIVNFRLPNENYNCIDTENIKGGYEGVKYLYEKGHRKIGFIAGELTETNSIDRLQGFNNAIEDYDLEKNEDWIMYGHFSQQSAYEAVGKMLKSSKKPTAIFCSDDYMAIGAMDRIKDEGLDIPDDIAVIGFDNIELAKYVKPSLTTIAQPLHKLGAEAGSIIFDIIDGDITAPVTKLLPVEIIERESA